MALSRSLIASACIAVCLAKSAGAQSMFRGGAEHLGVYQSAAPSLKEIAWSVAAGGRIVSSPLVVSDAVYFGASDGFLYAVNATSGTQVWKFDGHGAINSSPAFADGLVIASSLNGRVYAVDAETGKQRWEFRTGGEQRFTARGIHGGQPHTEVMPDPFDVFLSSPTIVGDIVYIGSGDHNVYALDAHTGALRWKFATGNVVHASPAVSNGVVYIGSWDRNMYALNASTGHELWRFTTGEDTLFNNQVGIASSAAVANGVVYFGCRDGHFYAMDARTGVQRWNLDNKGGWVIASPAISDGVVYFPTADGQRFKALDAETGVLKYSVENKTISFSSPAMVGSTIYFGSSDGWMHALDRSSGVVKAEFQSDGSKANSSKYVDEKGHLMTDALYPDRTLDGIIIGVHNMFTLGSFLSSPVVANGILYIGSTDGRLYALR